MGLEVTELSERQAKRTKEMSMIDHVWVNRYHKVAAGIFHAADIRYSSTKRDPEEPDKPETWQVGYIANVLWEDVEATYGKTKKSFTFGGPILDKLKGGGSEPWYGNQPRMWMPLMKRHIQLYKEFDYGGGMSKSRHGQLVAQLAFVDFPQRPYLNEFRGMRGGEQLREVKDKIRFGLWIAARRKVDPPNQVNRYSILLAKAISLPIKLEIKGGDFWPMADSKQRKRAEAWGTGNVPKEVRLVTPYTAPGQPKRIKISSLKPVVSGKLANDVLTKKLIASGICADL